MFEFLKRHLTLSREDLPFEEVTEEEDERETGEIYKGSYVREEELKGGEEKLIRRMEDFTERLEGDMGATSKSYDVSYSQITQNITLFVELDDGGFTNVMMSPEACTRLTRDLLDALNLHLSLTSPLSPPSPESPATEEGEDKDEEGLGEGEEGEESLGEEVTSKNT